MKGSSTDREVVADRLLRSSHEHSYDPVVDVDWDAPLVEGAYAIPPHRISLYGTALWDGLSEQQRVELSKHEFCSTARIGLWFEIILMQMLLRYAYDRDPTRRHVQYALTEIADECRHSVMFARMIERFGCPDYAPRGYVHHLGRFAKTVAYGPTIFAAALIAEEMLDQLQREAMDDASLQPLTRAVTTIHVTEEARHVRYAREELARIMPTVGRVQRAMARMLTAWIGHVIASNLVHPRAYAAVGLDPKLARRAALANPYYQLTLTWSARRLVPFLRENGLIGGPSARLWRHAHLS